MSEKFTILEEAAFQTGVPVDEILALASVGAVRVFEFGTGSGRRYVLLSELSRALSIAMRAVPPAELKKKPDGEAPTRMSGTTKTSADRLWAVIDDQWPDEVEWLPLGDVAGLAPFRIGRRGRMRTGLHGIDKKPTYEFAMLTVLCTARRAYVEHEDPSVDTALGDELRRVNRNNGIWRRAEYAGALVRRR